MGRFHLLILDRTSIWSLQISLKIARTVSRMIDPHMIRMMWVLWVLWNLGGVCCHSLAFCMGLCSSLSSCICHPLIYNRHNVWHESSSWILKSSWPHQNQHLSLNSTIPGVWSNACGIIGHVPFVLVMFTQTYSAGLRLGFVWRMCSGNGCIPTYSLANKIGHKATTYVYKK